MIGVMFVILAVLFVVVLAVGVLVILDKDACIKQLRSDKTGLQQAAAALKTERDEAKAALEHASKAEVTATLHSRMGDQP
ncbi:hypothetical protein [Nonomuraea sp. NPDC049028]|uniref:hypothetical protein n=1 Tax=Nonomuraea sp. NPDC049028 TaxID=3364348 RepID=UPI0037247667